jgi:hypothetical protein
MSKQIFVKKSLPTLFLIDAGGALLSLILLLVVYRYQDFFGIPRSILPTLFFLALVCLFFSLYSYFSNSVKWNALLRIVILLNCSYCILMIYQLINNYFLFSQFGRLYFLAEIVVLVVLITFEWYQARIK